MNIINKLDLTQDEESCIMHFLTRARQSHQEPWHPVIDSIVQKYMRVKYKPEYLTPQHWQTL